MLVVYAGILAFGLNEFRKTPTGFIPQLDRGYLIVAAQLAARRRRSRAPTRCMRRVVEIALQDAGRRAAR